MAIAPVTPPVAPPPTPPTVAVVTVSKSRGISTRAIGIAILVVAVLYLFGLPNLQTAGNNLGQWMVEITNPNRSWTIPNIHPDTIFMLLVIGIAAVFMFKKGR